MPRPAPRPTLVSASLATLLALATTPDALAADAATRVYLNGVPTPVYFNDGDSFRVLAGPFEGTKARLAGFNTLESFGAVHWWPGWTEQELYHLAKMGMMNARQGEWHCTSDLSRDGYGRMLWDCPGMRKDQVAKGLAHALSVNEYPAERELLKVQWEAIKARRGIWAHGVPEYILTSLHSMSEDPTRAKHYNRIVSPLDGHSEPWSHTDTYPECSKVCKKTTRTPAAGRALAVGKLREDAVAGPVVATWDDALVGLVVSQWQRDGSVTKLLPDEVAAAVKAALEGVKDQLGAPETLDSTCHVYVDFKRRFGLQRAACLIH